MSRFTVASRRHDALSAPALAVQLIVVNSGDKVTDTTIYDNDGSLSNGAGEVVVAGRTGLGQIRRSLLAFDLSEIPAGSTVLDAKLSLSVTQVAPGVAPKSLSLTRLTSAWGESGSNATSPGQGAAAQTGDATWTHAFYQTVPWAAPGGDFAGSPSASQAVIGIGTMTFTSTAFPSLLVDIQGWIDAPTSNFGWIVRGNEGVNSTGIQVASSEFTGGPAFRPTLSLTVVPVPEPSTYILLAMGLAVVAGAAIRGRRTNSGPPGGARRHAVARQ